MFWCGHGKDSGAWDMDMDMDTDMSAVMVGSCICNCRRGTARGRASVVQNHAALMQLQTTEHFVRTVQLRRGS
jgi:hypothetical protein